MPARCSSPRALNALALSLGALSLFISLGGDALATRAVSAVLKPGSVNSKAIKDRSIQTKDLSRATVRSLRGGIGPAGLAGPAGPTGPTGPAGPAGEKGAKGDPGDPASLADGAVTTPKLADGAVTGAKVFDATLAAADLGSDSVGTSEIQTNGVDASEVADNAIDSGEIADDSLFANDLAPSSVGTSELADGTVGNADLANNAVNSAKVVNNSLTTADIEGADVSGSISINAGAITSGRCEGFDTTAGGAQAGQAVVYSAAGPLQDGMVLYGQRVISDDHVLLYVCNFTGGANNAITNLPVRIITFG